MHALRLLSFGLVFLVGCDASSESDRTSGLQQEKAKSQKVASTPQSESASDSKASQTKPSVLVSPDWLAKQSDNPNVVLLGMGPTFEAYKLGHIPGERFIDWKQEMSDPAQPDRFNLLPPQQLEKLLGRLGVSNQSTVVLTDTFSSRLSTRMFWMLHCYGHGDIRILDGGQKAWTQSGKKLTTESVTWAPTRYTAGPFKSENRVLSQAIQQKTKDPDARIKMALIDGRPVKQFTGQEPGRVFHTHKAHKRMGHIPGAKNIFWKDNFDADGKFKSIAELEKLYADHGVRTDQEVISYCNEGLHAAPPWFVLKILLKRENIRVYDDSMSEWANRDDTALAKGAETSKTKK